MTKRFWDKFDDLFREMGNMFSDTFGSSSSTESTTRIESKSQNLSEKEAADFKLLSDSVDELIQRFSKRYPGGRIHSQISFEPRSGRTYEFGVVTCPTCGNRNRLNHGSKGAICGFCRTSLEKKIQN